MAKILFSLGIVPRTYNATFASRSVASCNLTLSDFMKSNLEENVRMIKDDSVFQLNANAHKFITANGNTVEARWDHRCV